MAPQSAPRTPADTRSSRRRRTIRIYLGMVIGIFTLAAAAVASGFLPS